MNWISETDYLDELHHNATFKDIIKGRILMDHLPDISVKMQQQVLLELDCFDPSFAIPLLGYIMGKPVSYLAFSHEDLLMKLVEKVPHAPDAFTNLFVDLELTNKTDFVTLAGMVPSHQVLSGILDLLDSEIHPACVQPLLAALGQIGQAETVGVIAEYLYTRDFALIHTAIQALAGIGTSEAVEALAARLGYDRDIDLAILDGFAAIKTEQALSKLAMSLSAPEAHIRTHAKTRLTELGQLVIPVLVQNLNDRNPDKLIHTMNVLGAIASPLAVRPIRNLLHNEPENANVRFAAYEALGMLPLQRGAYALTAGLTDSDFMVRIAAAKAVERNFDSILLAGLKNLIKPESKGSNLIVAALIDAHAEKILKVFVSDADFWNLAFTHLKDRALPETRNYFEYLLRQAGQSSLADQVLALANQETAPQNLLIYAIDDSRMVLNLYKNALYKLGYEVQLFEFPESALERIQQKKPDLIFTDLNMPNLTGIDLTTAVRQCFPKETLPIVMVTTQSEGQDAAKAYKAGVSTIIQKPFTAEKLHQTIKTFCQKL